MVQPRARCVPLELVGLNQGQNSQITAAAPRRCGVLACLDVTAYKVCSAPRESARERVRYAPSRVGSARAEVASMLPHLALFTALAAVAVGCSSPPSDREPSPDSDPHCEHGKVALRSLRQRVLSR